VRPFDDMNTDEPDGDSGDSGVSQRERRPLGAVLNSFALLAAGAALIGSLFTSVAFRLAGATDMSYLQILGVAGGVSAAMYVLIMLGGRHQDRNL